MPWWWCGWPSTCCAAIADERQAMRLFGEHEALEKGIQGKGYGENLRLILTDIDPKMGEGSCGTALRGSFPAVLRRCADSQPSAPKRALSIANSCRPWWCRHEVVKALALVHPRARVPCRAMLMLLMCPRRRRAGERGGGTMPTRLARFSPVSYISRSAPREKGGWQQGRQTEWSARMQRTSDEDMALQAYSL